LLVKVKLFGIPDQALRVEEFQLTLEASATVKDVLDRIHVQDRGYLYTVREGIRLNEQTSLRDGDELLVFPPITGGDAD
jgi:molybdopterin converting factor small subunit